MISNEFCGKLNSTEFVENAIHSSGKSFSTNCMENMTPLQCRWIDSVENNFPQILWNTGFHWMDGRHIFHKNWIPRNLQKACFQCNSVFHEQMNSLLGGVGWRWMPYLARCHVVGFTVRYEASNEVYTDECAVQTLKTSMKLTKMYKCDYRVLNWPKWLKWLKLPI